MTRESLLAELETYLANQAGGEDTSMAEATLEFVRREPRCAERSLTEGHLTASGWVVDRERTAVLLTHHRKLQMWLQLGGHADGDLDLRAVAAKEVAEESGLTRVRLVSSQILDIDRHWIPVHKATPGHWHYDVRFLFEAERTEPFTVSEESNDLAWVPLEMLQEKTKEPSMLRMARKARALAS